MLPAPQKTAADDDNKAIERIQRVRDATFHPLIEELAGANDGKRLKEALAASSQPKAHQLLADMLDPRFRKWNVSQLARKAGIDPPQLLEMWRSYSISRGISLLTQSAEHVAHDIAADARSKPACCPRCDGWGTIERTVTTGEGESKVTETESRRCPQCKGSGSVLESGDPASRKLMFEVLGYTGKSQPMIQTNIQVNTIESALDGLEQAEKSAGIAFSSMRPVVPSPSSPSPASTADDSGSTFDVDSTPIS